jgi:hypothetical protein
VLALSSARQLANIERMLVHRRLERMGEMLACDDFPLEYLASRLSVTGPRVRVTARAPRG